MSITKAGRFSSSGKMSVARIIDRRQFVAGAGALFVAGIGAQSLDDRDRLNGSDLDRWQYETDQTSSNAYEQYMVDGKTRGLVSLERLEQAFDKVIREVKSAVVEDVPAVWSVYNMGYVVKTRESLFSIDLVHRRATELSPLLDFALITHNHDDHYRLDFYRDMDKAGKTVISNFLDNYGVRDWHKNGGYVRGEKYFRIRDVEIRTSLVDHNGYLADFTTAFEIRVGNWSFYHTGDCGNAAKLKTFWGGPDLWTFFPGCGIDVAEAVRKIGAKRTVFGHLWELGHQTGRLTAVLVRAAFSSAESVGVSPEVAFWGDRIS